ncbi:hypothetical protein [Nocardioides alcanivorans]|uniref:hypothetical protein n=1 Tax=Nocardioides alcanivorans TaxID=2897352 RepID=UPI001F369E08|nr:hypothetical protein [Nocardioides alcanivorans]
MSTAVEPKAQPRHRWVLFLAFPLTCVAAGLGWGYGKGDLESRTEDAGNQLVAFEAEIRGGGLILGCAAGLLVFALMLSLFTLLNPAPTTGRRVVQWCSTGLLLVIALGLLLFAGQFYPELQERVAE